MIFYNSKHSTKYLSQKFSAKLLELIKKGVYPYEHMNSFKRFFDNRLPDKSGFYSSLRDESIIEKDYLYAVSVICLK